MPIWAETTVLALAGYAIGLAAAWLLWGRADPSEENNRNA